jgi:hypothetical protein
LEAAAGIICLVIAWRTRRTSLELGSILAVVPPFALAAIARMPLGELAVERARRIGALTIFAPPSRS